MKCEIEEYTPRRATDGSAGYDIYSPIDVDIVPGEWTLIDTLVSLEDDDKPCYEYDTYRYGDKKFKIYPQNWCMKIYPRSGLSLKTIFRNATTVGIIDMDYRDTIKLKVTADVPVHINKGDRIVQGIFEPVLVLPDEIPPTKKRKGGFGSTGA